MKNVKKIIAMLLVFATMFVAVGCKAENATPVSKSNTATNNTNSKSTEPIEPIELVIWGGIPQNMGPDTVVENYNKLMDGKVKITYNRYVVGEGDAALDMGLMAGEHIDAYLSHDFDKMAKRMSTGLAEDMAGLVKEYGMDLVKDFGDAAKPFIQDGKVFVIPTTKMGYFVYLNKDMLDAAKLKVPTDWTLDEFKSYAKAMASGSGANKVYGAMSHRNIFPVVLSEPTVDYQFYYNNDFTKSDWDKPAFRKSMETLFEMTNIDKSVPSYLDIVAEKMEETDVFSSGRAAMAVSLSYGMRNIKDTTKYPHTYVTTFAPLPKSQVNQSEYYTNQLLNDYFSINPKSEYKKEVFEFYKWFATEGYKPLIAYGRIPLYVDFDKDVIVSELVGENKDLFDTDALKTVLLGEVKLPQSIKTFNSEAAIYQVQKEEYEKYITGSQDLDTTIENLNKKSNEILAK